MSNRADVITHPGVAYGLVASELVVGGAAIVHEAAQLNTGNLTLVLATTFAALVTTGFNVETRSSSTFGKTELELESEVCLRKSSAVLAGGLALQYVKTKTEIPGPNAPVQMIIGIGGIGVALACGMNIAARHIKNNR